MMTTTAIHQGQRRPQQQQQQKCNSVSCYSPLRLWRTMQTLIQEDNKDEFLRLCERTPGDILVRVLLHSRVPNNPTVYSPSQKSRVIQFPAAVRQEAVRKFGKSATDLNALQLALLTHTHTYTQTQTQTHKSTLAHALLTIVKQHATPTESRLFVNQLWGQGNTSLHLACFWNLPQLVRLLLDMGALPASRNSRMCCPADLASGECLAMVADVAQPVPLLHPQQAPTTLAASSVLLRKAAEKRQATQRMAPLPPSSVGPVAMTIQAEYFRKPMHPPHAATTAAAAAAAEAVANVRMTFSSSSSSSSFSSLSSTDEEQHKDDDLCWTPPPSPITHQWTPPPTRQSYQTTLYSTPTSPPPPVPVRPACMPSTRLVKKQVRFEPDAMLIDACVRGDMQELASLLEADTYQGGGVGGVQNRSLLQIALMRGHEKLARFLVNHVHMDHKDSDGWTALHYAAALGLWRLLEFLAGLEAMDLNAKTNDGRAISDCPDTVVGRRKCRMVIERAVRRQKSTAAHHG